MPLEDTSDDVVVTTWAAFHGSLDAVASLEAVLESQSNFHGELSAVSGLEAELRTVSALSGDLSAVTGLEAELRTIPALSGNLNAVSGLAAELSNQAGMSGALIAVSGLVAVLYKEPYLSGNLSAVSGLVAEIDSPGDPVFPDPGEVLLGVVYGPSGTEYTGTLVGGGAEPLPPGTIVSPAAILAQYLIDELVLSSPSNDPLLEWPVFVNGMPATDSFIRPGQRLVAEIVGSYDTAGVVNSKDMMGKVWEHEGVTMLVRTIEPALGFAKASQIRDALAPVAGTEVTLEGETWKVLNVTRTTGIAAMGQDPETREDLFSLNFRVSLRRVV